MNSPVGEKKYHKAAGDTGNRHLSCCKNSVVHGVASHCAGGWGGASSLSKGELENEAEKQLERLWVELSLWMIPWYLPLFFFLCPLNADPDLTRSCWLERDHFFHLFSPSSPFSQQKVLTSSKKHKEKPQGFQPSASIFVGRKKRNRFKPSLLAEGSSAKKWGWLYIHCEKWRLFYWAKAWYLILDKNLWMWWKFCLSKDSDMWTL